ncbi:MAG: hypothetical protein IJ559_04490 [Prevotella sp.]|nr:hypothetical protein [Prevotella sp.]
MYKLSTLTRQQLSQLVHSQKAALLGHDSYRRFGARFPLHVRFTHSLGPQAFMPGQGAFCYVHRPVMGDGLVFAEINVPAVEDQSTPALTTAIYDLNDPMTIDYSGLDAFVLLIALEGACQLSEGNDTALTLCEGETLLVPASAKAIRVEGTVKLLEAYI